MKRTETRAIKCAIMFILCLAVFLPNGIAYTEEGKYPMKIEIINREQTKYDIPESTYAAMISSLITENLDWYYETFTEESAVDNKREYQEADIDPRKKFDTVKGLKNIFIIDKIEYKSGIVLVVETHEQNGTIMQGPSTFVQEHNKWKMTNKFASDEDLWEYLDYIKPEEIISSSTRIRPNRWNLNWYNWIKEHVEEKKWIRRFAERVCILCIIGDLKDNEGNPHRVEEIAQETLLLNYLVHPQPWKFGQEEKTALIFDLREGRDLNKMRGFKDWHDGSKFLKKYKGPVMLVKFNKFNAMETLSEMIPGKEYDIIVSGELKDGKRFNGSAMITITGWKAGHRRDWKNPDWLDSDRDTDNWWNKEKEKAFEDWWKKTKENYKR